MDALSINGQALLAENRHDAADLQRFTDAAAKLAGQSLLTLGKMRAFAELDEDQLYRPHTARDDEHIAEPMLRLAHLGERLGLGTTPTPAGTWMLTRDGKPLGHLVLASGGGRRRMAAVESRAKSICTTIGVSSPMPVDVVLIGGLLDAAPTFDHIDLIADEKMDDIIEGLVGPMLVSANDEDYIDQIGGLLNVA